MLGFRLTLGLLFIKGLNGFLFEGVYVVRISFLNIFLVGTPTRAKTYPLNYYLYSNMFHFIRPLTAFFVIFFINTSFVYAQKQQSVLWKISGKGLKKDSYLLGVAHTVSYKLIDSFPKLKQIFQECEFGIFEKSENSIGDVKDIDIKTPPLDSIFSLSEYALVDSFFTNSPYGSIKPHNNDASLGGMLQAILMLKNVDTKEQKMFFDEYIQAFFVDTLKRKTYGLDELKEKVMRSAKTNYRAKAETIVYLIKNDVDTEKLMEEIFDISLFTTSLRSEMKLNKKLGESKAEQHIKSLTIKRHAIWLPKIISKINQGSSIIVVGLLHLQYRTGLIQLLQKEGYKLEPVKLTKVGF